MNTEQSSQASLHISQEKLLTFVHTMIGGTRAREDDEHPLPPGPWDPVIRVALERISVFGPSQEPWRLIGPLFSPHPEPWRVTLASVLARHPEVLDATGGEHSVGAEVELNPQPLPPRFTFLVSVAQTVISRAELIQEVADATRRDGEQRGIIIVNEYLARFADDFCPNGFRLKYPFPWPRPRPHWFPQELDGIDLVVMAAQFEQAAKETFSQDLRQSLADASANFAQAGMSKMQ